MDFNLAVNSITFLDINDEMTTISFESQQVKMMWLTQINELKEGYKQPQKPIHSQKARTPQKKKLKRKGIPTLSTTIQINVPPNTTNTTATTPKKIEPINTKTVRTSGISRNSIAKHLPRKTVDGGMIDVEDS